MAHMTLKVAVKIHPRGARLRKRLNRKAKPVRPSRANELWYKAELLRIVKLLRSAARSDIIPLFKQVFGGDALPPSVSHQLQVSARKFGNIDGVAQRLAREAAQRNLYAVDKSLTSAIRRAVGVDLSGALSNDGIREAMAEAIKANVALITDIPKEYFSKLEKAIGKSWESGVRWEDIAAEVERVGDVTESRAKIIARDQTSKMNSAFNKERQTSIGIEKYQWQTSEDERVRESHAELDGQTFSWDDPPEVDGEPANPGEPILCRCVAIPVFDLDDVEEE